MSSSERPAEPPFVADLGVQPPAPPEVDPYQALDDLMAVVEILCPEWPVREPFVTPGKMLL